MSLVDDSLMGTIPLRSAKSGSKSAGLMSIGAGTKNAAFETAIADAGKKKTPANLPSLKDDSKDFVSTDATGDKHAGKVDTGKVDGGKVDGGKSLQTTKAADQDLPVTDVEASPLGLAAKAEKAAIALPIQNLAPKEDVSTTTHPAKAASDMSSKAAFDHLPIVDSEAAPASIISSRTPTSGVAGATELKLPPSMGKILDLAKDGKLPLAKSVDMAKAGSVEAKSALAGFKDDDQADIGSEAAETGGVSQLLALLGSPKDIPASATTETSTTPTELISEFQALADRAGKARSDGKQTGSAGAAHASGADANAVANATASGTDKIFRFARADGKGQSVSMTLNTDGDKPSAKIDPARAEAASNAKVETVTVLDSRRYLGVAANTNSQAVAAAVTGSTEWARVMQPSSGLSSPEAASAAGKVVNTLKIQMHPIDLGTVTATLRLKDDELHVDLKVESGEAFRQLSDDQNAMVKALRSQGFAVDQINITFNAPSDASAGNGGSQQPQAGQPGQQGREATGDGAAQGRGRNDNSSQQQSGERWTGNDGTDEASAVSERGRTDHTYM